MLSRRVFLVVALLAIASAAVADDAKAQSAGGQLPLVIFVRHAEKAATPADDPPLTADGTSRAHSLDSALASAGVTAIITTEFRRTQETAAPLATRRGLTPEVVNARGVAPDAHVQAVAAAVRKQNGGVVLVVGHSNTVPAVIAALGGEKMRDICDADYSNLFMLSQVRDAVSLVRSRYGVVPSALTTCAAMR